MQKTLLCHELITLAHLLKREADLGSMDSSNQLLTVNTGRILAYISLNKETPIHQRDIEERFMIRPSTVSANLKLLEQKGLILRQSSSSDGRLKQIQLTELGQRYCEAVSHLIDEIENKLRAALTAQEAAQFLELIAKLKLALER